MVSRKIWRQSRFPRWLRHLVLHGGGRCQPEIDGRLAVHAGELRGPVNPGSGIRSGAAGMSPAADHHVLHGSANQGFRSAPATGQHAAMELYLPVSNRQLDDYAVRVRWAAWNKSLQL